MYNRRRARMAKWKSCLIMATPSLPFAHLGRVVRTGGGQAAVRIERYQFKTRRLLVLIRERPFLFSEDLFDVGPWHIDSILALIDRHRVFFVAFRITFSNASGRNGFWTNSNGVLRCSCCRGPEYPDIRPIGSARTISLAEQTKVSP